jgi:hypothetical protein
VNPGELVRIGSGGLSVSPRLTRSPHVLLGFLCLLGLRLESQEAKEKVTYQDHVFPVLQNHCLACHDSDKKKGDLDLSSFGAAMAGGGSGHVAVAGNAGQSILYKVVAHLDDPKMPPKKPKLPDAELAVFKKWIDGGLLETASSKARVAAKPKLDLAVGAAAAGKPAGTAAMPEDLLLEPVKRTGRPEVVASIAASPWAPLVAVSGQHQVLLYHPESLELAGILPFPERRPNVLKFSRNGSLLLAGGGQGAKLGRVVVWDVKTGRRAIEVGQEYDAVLAADLSADQTRIALGGPGKLVKIFSTRDGDLEHAIKKHTDWVTAVEFSPDGVLLATGDRNGGLHVWEARSGNLYQTLQGHRAAVTDLSWRADSNVLASSGEDGQVTLWEMQNGSRAGGWAAHPGGVLSVEFSTAGTIATAGRDGFVRLWQAAGTKIRDLESFGDLATAVALTHDAARVVGGGFTGEVRVWSAADGRRLGALETNPPALADRLAADEARLAAARAEAGKREADRKAAEEAGAKAQAALAAADQALAAAKAALQAQEAKLAEAVGAGERTAKARAEAEAAAQARQAESAAKADPAARAAAAQARTAEELRKLQEAVAAALKALQEGGDPKPLEAAQKSAAEKTAELVKAAGEAQRAKAEAAQADSALAAARKALADAQAAEKAAVDRKAALAAAAAASKAALEAEGKAQAEAKKRADEGAVAAARAKLVSDQAAAEVAGTERRIASWKAAQFNLTVLAARGELDRLRAESDRLAADVQAARDSAAGAAAAVAAGEKAAVDAEARVKSAETAAAAAQEGIGRSKSAREAAERALAEREGRHQESIAFAAKLAGTGAAAKAQEVAAILAQEAEAGRKELASRAGDEKNAPELVKQAEAALAQARTAADDAAKKAPALQAAWKTAAEGVAAAQAKADAYRPTLDAGQAKVAGLHAEYLKLKPR